VRRASSPSCQACAWLTGARSYADLKRAIEESFLELQRQHEEHLAARDSGFESQPMAGEPH
jgi:hypothetical protein